MSEIIYNLIDGLVDFAFYYPFFMAYLWIIGALYYFMHWEKGSRAQVHNPPQLDEYPGVSYLVPCYNEVANIEQTIEFLNNQAYPTFDILAINDGSTDGTRELLNKLAQRYQRLRVMHLEKNQGKAMALRMGALMSPYEFQVCIDGDALLDEHATTWIMKHFVDGPRVGAVTGNPRVRTRSTLLGKIQVGEFSSIIGTIKRAQRIYGRVFTVSGVVSAFRKKALHDVGYWSLDMVAEDIDISWKFQLNHWDIRFEPNALCWILMPETLTGLWRQRLRWSQGGAEVLLKYFKLLRTWRSRRMWAVYTEYITSVIWSYVMAAIIFFWLLGVFIPLPESLYVSTLIPGWSGVLLGMTCMAQFFVSLAIDSRYEKGIAKMYYWMIWYPVVYWLLNVATTVVAVPKALLKKRGARARWESPDRGIQS